MASVDMFDKLFSITDKKATGQIRWTKEEVNVLSAYIVQVDGAGKVIGAAYGVAVKNPDNPTPFPVTNRGLKVDGEWQPTWRLPMRMVTDMPLQVGTPATGLALYRKNATLASWISADIKVVA